MAAAVFAKTLNNYQNFNAAYPQKLRLHIVCSLAAKNFAEY
jgi:hypothetical protein